MNLLHSIASLPLRMAADIRARSFELRNPVDHQHQLLNHLVARAADTTFGRDHGFKELADLPADKLYQCYSSQVPIRTYRRFLDDYFSAGMQKQNGIGQFELKDCTWPGHIPWFCETSGTTAPTKYIPFSREMFAQNRRAALDMMACYLAARPDSRLIGSKILYMSGPTTLNNVGNGVMSGDMSAITLQNRPAWLAPFVEPQEPLSSAPWDERLHGMARLLINDQRIRAISGVPPWILLLLKTVEDLSGKSIVQAVPQLELIIHGGASLTPYRNEFQQLFNDSPPAFMELLPSSEAFMGFQVYGEAQMRLTPFYGCFFEFVPMELLNETGVPAHDAPTVPLWQVTPGQRYAVILSTCAGLWRYHIGDTLRFLDNDKFHIEFTGRDKFLDRFEEKVTQGEVEAAVATVNAQLGLAVREFMVGPDIAARRHRWVLACRNGSGSAEQIAPFLDRFLMEANADYAAFRCQGRIHEPEVLLADEDMIYRWSKDARGKLGGQSKIPHIDPTLTGEMVADLGIYISRM